MCEMKYRKEMREYFDSIERKRTGGKYEEDNKSLREGKTETGEQAAQSADNALQREDAIRRARRSALDGPDPGVRRREGDGHHQAQRSQQVPQGFVRDQHGNEYIDGIPVFKYDPKKYYDDMEGTYKFIKVLFALFWIYVVAKLFLWFMSWDWLEAKGVFYLY